MELDQGEDGVRAVEEVEEERAELLSSIGYALRAVDLADGQLRQAVAAARAGGWSWREIGARLGTSASAAHQRFGARS